MHSCHFTICFSISVSTRAATHFTCGHFLSTIQRVGFLAKPLTATRVQKGLRLPALATTSWSRTSSVLTTTDSLPVDTLFNHVMLENPPKPLTDHDVPNVSVGTADHPCQVGPPEGNRAIGQTPRACRNALVPLRFFFEDFCDLHRMFTRNMFFAIATFNDIWSLGIYCVLCVY